MNDFKSWWSKLLGFFFIVCVCYVCYWIYVQFAINFFPLPDKGQVKTSGGADVWGVFGDYIGGVLGTILAFISVILLFITFSLQRSTSQREKFEAKYYELIKLHRDNVAELVLGQETGKKIFVQLLREFRIARLVVDQVLKQFSIELTQAQLMELTYMVLFYGTGPNSNRVLTAALPDYEPAFLNRLCKVLHRRKRWAKEKRHFQFTPFEGHQSRLGHYYRHLYQSITYVDTQGFLSPKEKRDYVKTIRAQLSNHEQAMLFLNSITRLGKAWNEQGLLVKYELIKNIPQSFMHSNREMDVKNTYPTIQFEYEEMLAKTNMKNGGFMSNKNVGADVGYNTAVQLLLYEGQMLWQIMQAFLLVNTILVGFIATAEYHEKMAIVIRLLGLILVVPWLGTFMRNSKYYKFRMEQAKHMEQAELQLLRGNGELLAEGKLIEVNGIRLKMNWMEHVMRNKAAGYFVIISFALFYIGSIIIYLLQKSVSV